MPAVSVATAKSHLSELLAKTSYAQERFIITKRNKPVAALVSLEDLKLIEQSEERQDFEEVEELISNKADLRTDSGTRQNVSL